MMKVIKWVFVCSDNEKECCRIEIEEKASEKEAAECCTVECYC
ncbi:UNVERIFIED_ORG: hypothetical protein BDK47_1314 [Anoxybacillus amylolyticus]|nr:hypothetical protein [Geobacillus sp. LEMMY01]